MTVAACLLLYSVVVLAAGPRLLRRLTRSGHVPRLGVAAWLTAIGTVLLTWLAGVVVAIADIVTHWQHRHLLVAFCWSKVFGVAAGAANTAALALLIAGLVAVTVATITMTVRLTRTLSRMRRRAHRHAQAVRVVGRNGTTPGVVVLEAAEPAAYCVSGRPPAIVLTSAALTALDEPQLAAVVEHERAHLAGHHSVIVAVLRSLATAFPRLTLITEGAEQVSRLLEMCADDAAAARHGRHALLSGLITLSGAAPAGALAAADVAVLARAERLSAPSAGLALARTRAALTSAVTVTAAGPLLIAALAASGVLMCTLP